MTQRVSLRLEFADRLTTVSTLQLSVQYAVAEPRLPRWRLRRWAALVQRTLVIEHLSLTLRLVGRREGRQLNAGFRGKDYATNVLTFAYSPAYAATISADIVLCKPVLVQEAHEQGKSFLAHAAHLYIHGILHAVGHDHLQRAPRLAMEALEIELLGQLNLPNPYQNF